MKASAELDRSVIAFSQVKDNIALDVRSAIRQIENSLRAIEAAKVSIELAEEVVSNEQERLNVGIGTTREVLEAQRDLIDAGVREITAVTSYNIALAELDYAKGTILKDRECRSAGSERYTRRKGPPRPCRYDTARKSDIINPSLHERRF